MSSDGDVNNTPTVVRQDDQHEQESISDRGHDQEIGGHDLLDMIRQESLPLLGRWSSVPAHVLRDCGLADVDAELQEFSVDSWCAPERVGFCHRANQQADVRRDDRSTPRQRRLFQVQKSRKPRRCQARTVSGLTMTTAARHSFQSFDSHTHSIRSARVSRSRCGRDRFTMWS
jgi:hypothetical protein